MEKKTNKFADFIERFGIYIFTGILIVVIGVSLGIIYLKEDQDVVDVVNKNDNETSNVENQEEKQEDKIDEDEETKPVEAEPITYSLPMNNATVIKDYTDTKLEYNPTLDRWESHFYIDMTSGDLSVMSIADGEVLSVDYDYLTGYVVTIQHDDGLVSCYASLGENVEVKVGDVVSKGSKIGEASSLASSSSKYGDHLEFSMQKDNKKIDPNNYLNLQNK